jgi:hypothetical protein
MTTLRSRLAIAGASLAVAALAALALALWPDSQTDKARADGKQLGEAVAALSDATTSAEVDSALSDIDVALTETRDHAGDRVADQASDQADALDRAADGFVGTTTSDDEFEADLYQAELDGAVDDLYDNASDFRGEGPEVQQAFWDGYQDGVSS